MNKVRTWQLTFHILQPLTPSLRIYAEETPWGKAGCARTRLLAAMGRTAWMLPQALPLPRPVAVLELPFPQLRTAAHPQALWVK